MSGTTPLPLLLFVCCFVYALVESKHKWKTVLYTAITMGFILAVAALVAWILPGWASAMGTLAGALMPIAGAIASISHAKGWLT